MSAIHLLQTPWVQLNETSRALAVRSARRYGEALVEELSARVLGAELPPATPELYVEQIVSEGDLTFLGYWRSLSQQQLLDEIRVGCFLLGYEETRRRQRGESLPDLARWRVDAERQLDEARVELFRIHDNLEKPISRKQRNVLTRVRDAVTLVHVELRRESELARALLLATHYLEESQPLLAPKKKAVPAAPRVRKPKPPPKPVEDEEDIALSPELTTWLEQLKQRTAGRRAIMVGGYCREERRREIERLFDFSELIWESTDSSDNFANILGEIKKSEWIFLNRFNRKKSRIARRVASQKGVPLVELPQGYNPRQVVYQTWHQLRQAG
jgi:hypothetical protein